MEREANLFLLDTMVAWSEIWKLHWNASTLLSGVVDFFVVVLKRAVFNGSTKNSFKIFLNFTYEEEFTVSLTSFFNLLGNRSRSDSIRRFNWNNYSWIPTSWTLIFFEPPDNSKQKPFPSPSSNTVILVTPDFSKYPIFRANFRFPLRLEKCGFNCILEW